MGISDENNIYADTGCIVMKVLLGIIAVAIFLLTPATSFANPDTRYKALNQYEAARNGLSASKGAQRYMGKRAPSLYKYYAAAETSSKKGLVDEGLEKSDKFQKLLKERNARIEAEEQRKWNNLSPEEKLETQREIRREWEKERADDTIKLLKADEAKKKAEADKKKAAKRKAKADGQKAERERRNDRLKAKVEAKRKADSKFDYLKAERIKRQNDRRKARSEWLRAKQKEDEAKGVDSNLGKDGDDSGTIRTSDSIESSPSITEIKNSEINTNKIDGGGAPNEKGMKHALGTNVTDNVMSNISSQTSSETNSAQNDMGTVRDERGNSAQSDHARGMERIKAQGRQVDKAIATGSDQHTSVQASKQTSRAESDVIGGAIGRGILEGGSTLGASLGAPVGVSLGGEASKGMKLTKPTRHSASSDASVDGGDGKNDKGDSGKKGDGCTDIDAENYDHTATKDDGSCQYREGCTDSMAVNYDANVYYDDGSCIYKEEEPDVPPDLTCPGQTKGYCRTPSGSWELCCW